jgi:hypothetical protein
MEPSLGTTTDASSSGNRINETGTDSNAGEAIAADGLHVPGVHDGFAVRNWLSRRNRERGMTWDRFNQLLERYPLPAAVAIHSVYRPQVNP